MPLVLESFTIYASANSYLGLALAGRLLAGVAVVHRRRPILIPRARGVRVADLVGGKETAARARYHREDCQRWARRHQIPLHLIEPEEFQRRAARWATSRYEREELPARAYYAAEELGRAVEMDRALFAAAWVGGHDVNEEDVVARAAAEAGLAPDDLLARARSDEMGLRARASLAAFDALECPGVPTFVLDGQRYWGKDRVTEVLEEIGGAAGRSSP
jgi:2-hydroxychromene-2-carboxylate isomerase